MSSLNKQALLRYRIVDELIQCRNYPTMQDIIDMCLERIGKEFSKETIQKDIEAMKNDLSLGYEAPIKYNRTYKGYEYTDKDFSINNTNLSLFEKSQIKNASEILLQFKEAKLGINIKTILQRLNIALNSPDLVFQDKVIDFEDANFNNYNDLNIIYQAIKNKNKINFVYYCYAENDINSYTAFPLLLKEYRNNWYLIMENINSEPQAMNLNYIFDVFELDTAKKTQNIVDYNKYLKHSIGVEIDSNYLEDLEIMYKSEISLEIKYNPLHSSQKIIEEYENGDLLVKYKMYITNELISEILKFGKNAFVTKNELVQQMIFEEIKDNWVEYRRKLNYW